jgi:hypothetical protein
MTAQQALASNRSIGKSDAVGYWVYKRRRGYLVLPLALPQHSLAAYNSINRIGIAFDNVLKTERGRPRSKGWGKVIGRRCAWTLSCGI